MFLEVGKVVSFLYGDNVRTVRIEKMKRNWSPLLGWVPALITGWDFTVSGYRSFTVSKMAKV